MCIFHTQSVSNACYSLEQPCIPSLLPVPIHRSHLSPVTCLLQTQRPVVWSQSSRTDPYKLQLHAATVTRHSRVWRPGMIREILDVVRSSYLVTNNNLTLWRLLLPYYGYSYMHPVPERVKPSFVIFDIRALWRSGLASECPDVKNYKRRLNPFWHRIHIAVPIWQQ